MQLWDQFLSLVVWKEPVYIGQQALIQLPRLSPSLYELRLSRDCKEISDFLIKLTVVDEWLELRSNNPKTVRLQRLKNSTGGQLIEITN